MYSDKNVIGVDIKGARMWTGATEALKNGKAVIDASALQPGDELTTRFAKGEIKSIVTKK